MSFPVVEVTRSLSNLIKSPFVNMQGKEKVLISYEERDAFVPLKQSSRVIVSEEESGEEKKKQKKRPDPSAEQAAKDELARKKEAEKQAEWILAEAREQADRIQEEAQRQAEGVRVAAREEGIRLGREEGLTRADEELAQVRADIEEAKVLLEEEHRQMAAVMEAQYVEVLCDLIRKLTGVLLRDKKDVRLHLIRSGISDTQPSNHYTLRVASDDLTLVENHLDEILMNIDSGVSIDVKEEKGLEKNECIIETDTQMVDCGFRTQLDNLITTLHMLVP